MRFHITNAAIALMVVYLGVKAVSTRTRRHLEQLSSAFVETGLA